MKNFRYPNQVVHVKFPYCPCNPATLEIFAPEGSS